MPCRRVLALRPPRRRRPSQARPWRRPRVTTPWLARKSRRLLTSGPHRQPTPTRRGWRPTRTATSGSALAVTGFAAANGYEIVAEFYDVVSGADPIDQRPGFKAMLDRIAGNGVRDDPGRDPRPLRPRSRGAARRPRLPAKLGVELVPASAPSFFLEDTPTAVLVRQVLGAISQFEKTCWSPS